MNDQSMSQRVAELERRIEQMYVRGTVEKVSEDCQRVKVRYGEDQVTGWLEWKPLRSGKGVIWWVPEKGEGVTVVSPGDLTLGEVIPGSYHESLPAPSSDPDLFLIQFGDGGLFSYHRDSGDMMLNAKGDVGIKATGNIDVVAGGDLKFTASRIDLN